MQEIVQVLKIAGLVLLIVAFIPVLFLGSFWREVLEADVLRGRRTLFIAWILATFGWGYTVSFWILSAFSKLAPTHVIETSLGLGLLLAILRSAQRAIAVKKFKFKA